MQIFIPVTIPWYLFVNNRYKSFCIIFVIYLFNQNILFSIVPHNDKTMNEILTLWILLIPTTIALAAYYFIFEYEPHNNALRDRGDQL
jgi:glucan phosphoethanolaminetransferase (alkaline phosphatase superfamily)